MIDKNQIANDADVIISGYAVSKNGEGIKVVNLNNGGHSAIVKEDGTLIETNMDDIELVVATEYALKSLKYMENKEYA